MKATYYVSATALLILAMFFVGITTSGNPSTVIAAPNSTVQRWEYRIVRRVLPVPTPAGQNFEILLKNFQNDLTASGEDGFELVSVQSITETYGPKGQKVLILLGILKRPKA